MTATEHHAPSEDPTLTAEGAPGDCASADVDDAVERLREMGAVLRLSEADAADARAEPDEVARRRDDDHQHGAAAPVSTHGVLRLMLELEGETVLRTKPIIGYLHTGMEKTGEELTYLQGPTNVTRMDYASPLFNELAFSLTVEKLLGIEVPERATWIRMLMTEMNRISSHLLFLATNGMDLGAVVDDALRLARARGGAAVLREGHRPADEPQLHPARRRGRRPARRLARRRAAAARHDPAAPRRVRHADDRPADLARAAAGRRRHHHRGVHRPRRHRPDPALHRLRLGPAPRHAVPRLRPGRLRRRRRHATATASTATPSASTRSASRSASSARSSTSMPKGDYRIQDKKVTPPPRARIDESMEALIHHFKIFTEGFKVPEGEAYVRRRVAPGRARLLHRVATAASKPYRMHIRGPSFVNLQTLPHMMHGGLIADARRRHLVGRPDHGRGRSLMARLTAENVSARRARSSAGTRCRKSALIPLLHLAQEQDGYVTDDAMEHIAELVGVTRPRCSAPARFYEMFKLRAGRARTSSTSAPTSPACSSAARSCCDHAEQTLGIKPGSTTADGLFTLEDVECIAACTEAPCLQVNYRYFHRVTHDELRPAGRRPARRPARRRGPAARHPGPRPPAHPRRPRAPAAVAPDDARRAGVARAPPTPTARGRGAR